MSDDFEIKIQNDSPIKKELTEKAEETFFASILKLKENLAQKNLTSIRQESLKISTQSLSLCWGIRREIFTGMENQIILDNESLAEYIQKTESEIILLMNMFRKTGYGKTE